jgi:hypothetical protein
MLKLLNNMIKNLLIISFLTMSVPLLGQENIPQVNKKIIEYTKSVIGTQVGRGECWDLADQALTASNARFDKTSKKTLYIFGEEYNPSKKKILPGDIIQFKNVVVKYQKGNMIMTENFGHHTAIVYEVLNEHQVKLAHQNTGFSGKKVGVSELDLEDVKKGKMTFFRPISDH